MENITEKSYETIRKLILESEWGRSVREEELFGFLFNEVYEFIDGCSKKDIDNMLEEASDVLMILLYIVIKNVDNQEKNQIEELLYRVNKKLQTRYSVFFEGNEDSKAEEEHWMRTKHIEKEILDYLYCPNLNCSNYAEPGKGNMMIEGNSVTCRICGYTEKYSSHNTVLYRVKYRRRLLHTMGDNYAGYLKGILSYADVYFNSYRNDYLKIMRFWISNKVAGLALKNYFISKHNASEKSFDEFLLYPLRNFLKNMLGNQEMKLTRSIIEINDFMLKCVNISYTEMKKRFCEGKNTEWEKIWIEYMGYLTKSMIVPVEYKAVDQSPKEILDYQDVPLNMYHLYADLDHGKKIPVFFVQFSTDDRESGVILKADLSGCRKNTQVGRVLLSVIMKFNLQYISKLRCILSNIWEKAEVSELSAFLHDILPIVIKIEYR